MESETVTAESTAPPPQSSEETKSNPAMSPTIDAGEGGKDAPLESSPVPQDRSVSDDEDSAPLPPSSVEDDASDDSADYQGSASGNSTTGSDNPIASQDQTTGLETISPPSELQAPKRQKSAAAMEARPPLSPKSASSKKESHTNNKKAVIPFVHDPNKVTIKFLFANKDGLSVQLQFTPNDTVGEVKASLLSMWPDAIPPCSGGENMRLICMGKGVLMPDTRTLKDCEVPVFETHATPVNVSVRPTNLNSSSSKKGDADKKASDASPSRGGSAAASRGGGGTSGNSGSANLNTVDQGCSCTIL